MHMHVYIRTRPLYLPSQHASALHQREDIFCMCEINHAYVCTQICICACVCACVCIYVCVYIYTHTYTYITWMR